MYTKALLIAKITKTVLALEHCTAVNTLAVRTITGGTSTSAMLALTMILRFFTQLATVR